jgi:hypothetical protein
VAGGTDLWPNMKRRHQSARVVVSLMTIPELRGVSNGDPLRDVRLGATALLDAGRSGQQHPRRHRVLARHRAGRRRLRPGAPHLRADRRLRTSIAPSFPPRRPVERPIIVLGQTWCVRIGYQEFYRFGPRAYPRPS